MIILDTNVLSELMRPSPAQSVLHWFAIQPVESLFTTSITQSEIYHGILLLPEGDRRKALQKAAEAMFSQDFRERILFFTSEAALPYAECAVARRALGRPISQFDAQIVAIAKCHRATVATRNVKDFELCGLDIVNPWEK